MKLFQANYHLLMIFLLIEPTAIATATATIDPKYAKTGCQVLCGNVTISYPFGIGVDCSVSDWYNVDCNQSTPYLRALNNVQILEVNIKAQTIIVNVSMLSNCSNLVRESSKQLGVDLGGSPFLFSRLHNQFVVEGCGNAFVVAHGTHVVTGCSTTCGSNDVSLRENDRCLGITCCQTTLPNYLDEYTTDLTGLQGLREDGACGSAFLVDKKLYVKGSFSGDNYTYLPISLLWTLSDRDFNQIKCCDEYDGVRFKADMDNGTSIKSWKCIFPTYIKKGNPYLSDGCDELPEMTSQCQKCEDDGGWCAYYDLYDDYDRFSEYEFHCSIMSNLPSRLSKRRSSMGAILGVIVSVGVLFLVAISFALYKVIKKTNARRCRRRFFKRNGGLLLKQQQESDPSLVGKVTIFTSHELVKATDYFSENRILGVGGQGAVYKAMLEDGRNVAVKISKRADENQVHQFINEVVIQSQVNHHNLVKLLGCCLETEVPLLVFEFISNGTLYDRIHNDGTELPLSLKMRIEIARDVARALAYLHCGTSIPIHHRDIKTSNILLDGKNVAKVSDFGTSRFVPSDESTPLTTDLFTGTFGYVDPEYLASTEFTEKSDVYSFGVVLVEILTSKKPNFLNTSGEKRSLVVHFTKAMVERCVISIFDAMIIHEGTRDELLALANLAMRCLKSDRESRPTMKEVELELEVINRSHVPYMIQANSGEVMGKGKGKQELSMPTHAESSSTAFKNFNDTNTSQ